MSARDARQRFEFLQTEEKRLVLELEAPPPPALADELAQVRAKLSETKHELATVTHALTTQAGEIQELEAARFDHRERLRSREQQEIPVWVLLVFGLAVVGLVKLLTELDVSASVLAFLAGLGAAWLLLPLMLNSLGVPVLPLKLSRLTRASVVLLLAAPLVAWKTRAPLGVVSAGLGATLGLGGLVQRWWSRRRPKMTAPPLRLNKATRIGWANDAFTVTGVTLEQTERFGPAHDTDARAVLWWFTLEEQPDVMVELEYSERVLKVRTTAKDWRFLVERLGFAGHKWSPSTTSTVKES